MVANNKCYLQKQRRLAHFAGIRSGRFHTSECRQLRTGQCEVKSCIFTSEWTVSLIRRERNSDALRRKETHWFKSSSLKKTYNNNWSYAGKHWNFVLAFLGWKLCYIFSSRNTVPWAFFEIPWLFQHILSDGKIAV